jgi:outer membrane protein assembly factor BamE (lipoprotein component of BamABCDE complex)
MANACFGFTQHRLGIGPEFCIDLLVRGHSVMRTAARWLAVILAVASAAWPVSAQPLGSQFLVVPGRSVGPVALGMTMDNVKAVWGSPTQVDRDANSQWYTWRDSPPRSVAVEMQSNMVVMISIAHDPRYRTRDGLGDGDSADRILRLLGRPSHVRPLPGFSMLEYKRLGVAFVIDRTQHVSGVIVAASL